MTGPLVSSDLRSRVERLLAEAGSAGTLPKYLSHAGKAELESFLADFAGIDLEWLRKHQEAAGATLRPAPCAPHYGPVEPVVVGDRGRAELADRGRESLRNGEWAALVFAGGAGTRFGGGAKGLVPLTPVLGRSFLELFAAQALAAGVECGRTPLLILMTSSITAPATGVWLRSAVIQGFPRPALLELRQAEHPRLDDDGDIICEEAGHIVGTGDGHGGAFRALLAARHAPGATGEGSMAERLRAAGIRSLVLHNVDNAGARAFEPWRLGLHRQSGKLLTLSVAERAHPKENVGLVLRNSRSGRVEVVEYSVCPQTVAESPRFRLAHVNTNLVELEAVRPDLPPTLYRDKQIAVAGREIATSSLEMLNQSLAALLGPDEVEVVLVPRDEFFLPTKTLDGEDSLAKTRSALSRQAAERLRKAGAQVDGGAQVEIDPCVTDTSDAARSWAELDCTGWRIEKGARLALAVRHGAAGRPVVGRRLVVGEDATLRVVADLPYGRVRFDSMTRSVAEDGETVERVSIGNDVRVAARAEVLVRGTAGAGTVIDDNAVLT